MFWIRVVDDDIVDIVGSQFFIKNVLCGILVNGLLGETNMENIKVVFASVTVTLVVVFGFMAVTFFSTSIAGNAPLVLNITIVTPQAGGEVEPVVVESSEYSLVDEETSVIQAQAFSVAESEMEETEEEEEEEEEEDASNETNVSESVVINYSKYNIDYIGAEEEEILSQMIGSNKTVFYLPPTGYINVSKGTSYGVAYALTNIDSSDGNSFVFDWTMDDSIKEDCGVSTREGQSWIERGWGSWGNIPEGRVDPMTIYFSFPEDAPSCTVRYDFVVEKDGIVYDTKQVEFRII